MLRENVEQYSHKEKKCKLNQDHAAAREQRFAAVLLIARRQQSLHDGLICSMARHRKKSAADYSRPKRIFGRKVKRKIEELQFVVGRSRDIAHFAPTAGNRMQQISERY